MMPRLVAPLLAVAALVAACGGSGTTAAPSSSAALAGAPTPSPAFLALPTGTGPAPVVVLVPGGSWTAADPSGLAPLAGALSSGGAVGWTTTYRVGAAGTFPKAVEDVLCAAATAVAHAKATGHAGGPLVLVGHSAGGPLAMLAALRPDDFRGDCTAPPVRPDAVVGLAGAYDLEALGDPSLALLGKPQAEAPDLWRQADTYAAAAERPDVPVLLVHGTADDQVPPAWSMRLRDELAAGHHKVRLEQPKGVDHLGVYDPSVSGPLILDWLARDVTHTGAS